jgi:hypothetical protein
VRRFLLLLLFLILVGGVIGGFFVVRGIRASVDAVVSSLDANGLLAVVEALGQVPGDGLSGGELSLLTEAAGQYGKLLENPDLSDADWVEMVGIRGKTLDLAYAALSRITPPAELAGLHAASLAAARECMDARDLAQTAISSVDAASLGQISRIGASCVAKVQSVQSELTTYTASKGISLTELVEATQDRLVLTDLIEDAQEKLPLSGPSGSVKGGSVINTGANLRSGPGTDYGRIGSAPVGATVEVIGRSADGE